MARKGRPNSSNTRRMGNLSAVKRSGTSSGMYVLINGKYYPVVTVRKKKLLRKKEDNSNNQVMGKSLFG